MMTGVKLGHNLPWTAGSNPHSQAHVSALSWLIPALPCPQGHKGQDVCELGKGKILACHHIPLKLKDCLLRMASLQQAPLGSTGMTVSALKLRPSCLVNQMTSFNPKEGLSRGGSAKKLWTPTMWSKPVGSGLV